MSHVRRSFIVALTASFALGAVAQAAPRAADKRDPNQIVCEKQEVLGSRLAVKRVCMTRAEWAEQRRLDRQSVEKQQTTGGCVKGAGC